MDKPEALLLAESAHLGYRIGWQRQAAAELRRLHAENEALRNVANRGGHIAVAMSRIADLEAQRDALLEALNSFMYEFGDKANSATVQKARAAIKSVEGEKNHG